MSLPEERQTRSMTLIAIIPVTTSAFIHALWNLLGKRQNPSAGFFLIVSSFARLVVFPILLGYRNSLSLFPLFLWRWVFITSCFQIVYYLGLAGTYRHGDMSMAYPLVRALPVVLVPGSSPISHKQSAPKISAHCRRRAAQHPGCSPQSGDPFSKLNLADFVKLDP